MSRSSETWQRITAKKKIQKQLNKYLGMQVETNRCGTCVIIDYKGYDRVTVRFICPEYEKDCQLGTLLKGEVINPYYPTIHGKGFIGVGKYTSKDKKLYDLWTAMLGRCYAEVAIEKHKAYKDVEVCEDWLNFQNFAEWCDKSKFFHFSDSRGKRYQLDKDLLSKGNKIYSPDTCCFIPQEVNKLIARKTIDTGKTGVYYHDKNGKFSAQVRQGGQKFKFLGYFDTEESASKAYRAAKESHVKVVANRLRGRICERAYEGLMKWCVL